MLRIENLLLRGDGQVSQGRMLEETSLVQGQGGATVENGAGAGSVSGSGSSTGAGGGAGGSVGAAGPTAVSAAPNGAHHESGLGALGAATTACFISCAVDLLKFFLL